MTQFLRHIAVWYAIWTVVPGSIVGALGVLW